MHAAGFLNKNFFIGDSYPYESDFHLRATFSYILVVFGLLLAFLFVNIVINYIFSLLYLSIVVVCLKIVFLHHCLTIEPSTN